MATVGKEEVAGDLHPFQQASEDQAIKATSTTPRERDVHSLQLKPEFILQSRSASLPPIVETGKEESTNDRKKNRGRNKKRSRDVNITDDLKVCLAILRGEECSFGAEKCRFSHDLKAYLATRPPDIKIKGFLEACPIYERSGFCHFGCMCRLGDSHINPATGANLGELRKDDHPVMNSISSDLRTQLRKSTYPFVCQRQKFANKNSNGKKEKQETGVAPATSTDETMLCKDGPDFSPLPTKTRKIVDFSNKVYIAPLSTYFRSLRHQTQYNYDRIANY